MGLHLNPYVPTARPAGIGIPSRSPTPIRHLKITNSANRHFAQHHPVVRFETSNHVYGIMHGVHITVAHNGRGTEVPLHSFCFLLSFFFCGVKEKAMETLREVSQ